MIGWSQLLSSPLRLLLVLTLALFWSGCLLDSSSKSDVDPGPEPPEEIEEPGEEDEPGEEEPGDGEEDFFAGPPTIVAYGDSITRGSSLPTALPYPARVEAMVGRRVINESVPGEGTCRAASRVEVLQRYNADTVMIMYGTNDVLGNWNLRVSKECLRNVIRAVKAMGARPLLATIPPMIDEKERFMPAVEVMNEFIWELARQENVQVVDVFTEFGTGEGLFLPDGFHPNEVGTQLIAFMFAEAL